MLDFLAGISNAIVTAFQLLINLISGMVQLVALSFDYIGYLMLVIGKIPPPLLAFAAMGIFTSAILFLVGRNT